MKVVYVTLTATAGSESLVTAAMADRGVKNIETGSEF